MAQVMPRAALMPVLLALCASVQGTAPSCTSTILPDTDFAGRDIPGPIPCNVSASSPADCCQKCGVSPACMVWTFMAHSHKCCFKTSAVGRRTLSGLFSGCGANVDGKCQVPIPPVPPVPPSPPPPPGPCIGPEGCSLNGECTNGVCTCDRPWSGKFCGTIDFEPEAIAAYGSGDTASTSSWGGGPPVWDAATKQWHLFVTEIAGHCGMATWSRMSQAAHAVSNTPAGPYRRVGVAVETQAHNVFYAYSEPEKLHLIYTLFDGASPKTCNPYLSCDNGSTPGAPRGTIRPPPGTPWPKASCPPKYGAFVHYSASLDGPWKPAGEVKFDGRNLPSPACSRSCSSNPAPYIFPNGTVIMLTRGSSEFDQNIVLWRASSWNATYNAVHSNGVGGATNMGNGQVPKEDPVLYRGRRGFHALLHSASDLTHAWSVDGINWDWSPEIIGPPRPPNCTVCHNERPRVTLDARGDLSVVFVAVSTGEGDASRTASFVGRKA